MDHFSHFHKLTFIEECEFEGTMCYGCFGEISGSLYGCKQCQLFLHKSCAEAPMQMAHHFHPQHQLSLTPRRSSFGGSYSCDICGKYWRGFTYRCSTCDFNFDIKCALFELKIQQPKLIQHASHKHMLIPLEKPINLLCDACNTKHEGSSYLCTECGFWVNQDCANSLPTTIELGPHNRHPHPLTLIYSITHKDKPDCNICFKTLTRNQWAYFCSKCNHFFHINCLKSEIQHSRDQKAKTKDKEIDPNLLNLPRAYESVDLIVQLISKLNSDGTRDQQQPSIIHDHQLINSNDLKTDQHSKQSDIRQCNGCGWTILAGSSYLQCVKPECNFFIHNCCAELPNELEHPCHPQHPIHLITHQSPEFCPRYCNYCELYCNTFLYGCDGCDFYMDVKCASLPIGIGHASHQHTLALRQSSGCSLCDSDLGYFSFVCETCSHKVCIQCALLPEKISHRYDKHPFILTYPTSGRKDEDRAGDDEEHHEEDYCEICEEDIVSKRCFYHCPECDQSLHIKCFYSNFNDRFSNIKYGINFRARYQPHHLLTCVRSPKDGGNSRCSICEISRHYCDYFPLAFECADCDYWVDYYCGRELFDETKRRPMEYLQP